MKLRLLDIAFFLAISLALLRGTAFDPFRPASPISNYLSDCGVISQPLNVSRKL